MRLTIHNVKFAGKSLAEMTSAERAQALEYLLSKSVVTSPSGKVIDVGKVVKQVKQNRRRAAARKAVATKRSKS